MEYKRNYTPEKNNQNNFNPKGTPKDDIDNFLRNIQSDKPLILKYAGIASLISIFISGILSQKIANAVTGNSFHLFSIFKYALSGGGVLLTIVMEFLLLFGGLRIYMRFKSPYTVDDRGDLIDESNSYGDDHFQRPEEKKEWLIMDKDPLKIKGDILGIDPDSGQLCSPNYKRLLGSNMNKAVIGASGSGKSESLVYTMIYQAILRGDSIMVSDSKGDVYRRTAGIAKKNGYIVRVLNLKGKELKNSDGIDLMKPLHGDDIDANAEIFSNTIIQNTGDGKMDYFATNEMNLLKALLIKVASDPILQEQKKNNLTEVYRLCSHYDPDKLKAQFDLLDEDDPAKESFNIYYACEPKVRGQILNGMAIRLEKLSNKYIRQIVSNDEIDFLLPYHCKCIYYCIIPDTTNTYKMISSLYYQEALMMQSEYADAMTEEQKKRRKHIVYILDEFASTGGIVDFDKYIAVTRSRSIALVYIIQDIIQLQKIYPDSWQTILNNSFIKIFLSTTDPDTAKYFSSLLGVKSIKVLNRAYVKSAENVTNGPGEYRITEGSGQKEVMSPSQLINSLSEDDLIIHIGKRPPLFLQKYLSFNHPFHKEVVDMIPNHHLPKWRMRLMEEEKELKDYEAALAASQGKVEEYRVPEVDETNMTPQQMQKAAAAAAEKIREQRRLQKAAMENTQASSPENSPHLDALLKRQEEERQAAEEQIRKEQEIIRQREIDVEKARQAVASADHSTYRQNRSGTAYKIATDSQPTAAYQRTANDIKENSNVPFMETPPKGDAKKNGADLTASDISDFEMESPGNNIMAEDLSFSMEMPSETEENESDDFPAMVSLDDLTDDAPDFPEMEYPIVEDPFAEHTVLDEPALAEDSIQKKDTRKAGESENTEKKSVKENKNIPTERAVTTLGLPKKAPRHPEKVEEKKNTQKANALFGNMMDLATDVSDDPVNNDDLPHPVKDGKKKKTSVELLQEKSLLAKQEGRKNAADDVLGDMFS